MKATPWGSVAEASTDAEPDSGRPQTAKQAKELWNYIKSRNALEAERMRYCCGCVWLKSCGAFLCCSHLLDTGKRRPCPPGKDCTEKRTPDGWKYPKNYAEWCAEADRKRNDQNKRKKRHDTFQWQYAKQLYLARYHAADIAEICGLNVKRIREAATTERWKNGETWRVKKRLPDLSGEKELYQREKEAWERQNSRKDE